MENQKELIPVKEKDAKELTESIVEVEASRELFEEAAKKTNYSSKALTDLLDYFMQALKRHKALWMDLLFKYVGEEKTLFYRDMYRFDMYKKVIFLLENEGEE
jgi:hypothetical protein